MAGRGKSNNTQRETKSKKAGLQFPVARVIWYLKKRRYSKRIGTGAGVYLAAVLEYLTAEILELAGKLTRDKNKKTINPQYIQLIVRNDEELDKLFGKVTIAAGGVLPVIHSVLLPGGKHNNAKTYSTSSKITNTEPKKKEKKGKNKAPVDPDLTDSEDESS